MFFSPGTHNFPFWPQYLPAAGRSVGVVLVKQDVKVINFKWTWVANLIKTDDFGS